LVNTERGAQDISLYIHVWRSSQDHARTVSFRAFPSTWWC